MTERNDAALNAALEPHRYLGLRTEPFADTADDAFFFPSDQHLRALEFMGQTLWTRARLGVITADHGCGKSFTIRRLLRDLDERVVVAAVQREKIEPKEFLLEILRQFGFSLDDNDKTDRRRLLERFLHHQAGMGRICVLIVENAQSMHPSVLEELRCLAATHVEGARVLKVLMLGQPALNLVLDSPRMGDLGAARASRFTLGPLSEDQTAAYVAHRLRAAGADNPDVLMPHTLMPQIHACSLGVPAKINQLCSQALAQAARQGISSVSALALDLAIEELGLQHRRLADLLPADDMSVTRGTANPAARLAISMQGTAERDVSLVGSRILVGRGEEADVRIDSVFVSRYHALIVRDGDQDLLLDLGSTNGLLVNSRRIVRRALRHRDLIQIGPARAIYLNELAMPAAQPDPGETICFARPGFPAAAGEEDAGALLAFGRLDGSGTP
jgi:type II secretory pathway predicted ATPase ExeA